MSLRRYSHYRDSGIPWVGQIPSQWSIQPLVGVVSERTDRNIGMREDNLLSLSYGRIVRKNIDSNDGLLPESFETYQVVQPGDVVLRLTDLQNDKRSLRSASVKEKGIITSAYLAIQPLTVEPDFLAYLLRAYDLTKVFYSMGGGLRQSMKFSELRRMPMVIPSAGEQVAIVAFLDRETTKIDALIAEQEKLILLLAEKRQATISHTVTRGLNPAAPMRNSGVTWLGEVPAHWSIGKIQTFARRESGHTPSRQHPEYWEDCTIPWFSLADVWQIRDGSLKYVYETKEKVSELGIANSSARLLPAGTVMLSRTASVGYSAIMGCDMATTQDFINWVCEPRLEPEFLLYVLRGMRSEFDRLMLGSTHQTIYMPDVARLMMALPPQDEQTDIIAHLDAVIGGIDALKAESERALILLKERRSALIAAAVTGQIDVRSEVSQQPVRAREAVIA